MTMFDAQLPEANVRETLSSDQQTLRVCVTQTMSQYFAQVGDQPVTELYELVLSQVEEPLLKVVMDFTRGNQTRAAEILGLNRGTLRKKLKLYNML